MYTFLRFPGFKRKAVTLSYDDCPIHDYRLVEIFNKYGLKATFNISSALFENLCNRSSKEDALALYANSEHEIAVHGRFHWSLADVDPAMATKDIISDRENLERLFGRIIKGMAYANGSVSDTAVDIARNCGIKYARTCESTENFHIPFDWLRMPSTCHHDNPRLMELAKRFVEAKEADYFWANYPLLFYVWGHSFEFNNKNNWEVIEEFGAYIGNREDIWYATNVEIYDYVQSYNRLEYSADGTMIYNPSVQDVYLYYFQKEILVPAGQTVTVDRVGL